MEAVRQKMIIFRYQLLHIGAGKKQITDTLQVVQPDIKWYEDIVKQLKVKNRERRTLLEEKKTMPVLQVLRHRELTQKIAGLTEDIEELKSEKALLINQFSCADDLDMTVVKQRVASMESSLKKLGQQEEKYTTELDAALAQYTELQRQAADIDTTELETACQAVRPDIEREATQRLQAVYRQRFDPSLLTQSQKDVARLLDETQKRQSIHQQIIHWQQSQSHMPKHQNEKWERDYF